MRDRAPAHPGHIVETTDQLIGLVGSGVIGRLCVLTHPERWSHGLVGWWLRGMRDAFENVAKLVLARVYDLVH